MPRPEREREVAASAPVDTVSSKRALAALSAAPPAARHPPGAAAPLQLMPPCAANRREIPALLPPRYR